MPLVLPVHGSAVTQSQLSSFCYNGFDVSDPYPSLVLISLQHECSFERPDYGLERKTSGFYY